MKLLFKIERINFILKRWLTCIYYSYQNNYNGNCTVTVYFNLIYQGKQQDVVFLFLEVRGVWLLLPLREREREIERVRDLKQSSFIFICVDSLVKYTF